MVKTYNHNQICTENNEIEVGKQYDYKEEGFIRRVLLLEDNSDKEWIRFKFKTLSEPRGEEFEVSAAILDEPYVYSGMWRVWSAGEYLRGDFSEKEIIPEGKLIGYSLSKCITSILRNKIDLNRIDKIITQTKCINEERWRSTIESYYSDYWYCFSKDIQECKDLVNRLRVDGKIFQPRAGDIGERKSNVVWEGIK